jgi:PAS domain-containing protein
MLPNEHQLAAANLKLESGIAERKLAEQALRDSEGRYRLLFKSNPFRCGFMIARRAFLAGTPQRAALWVHDQNFIEWQLRCPSP